MSAEDKKNPQNRVAMMNMAVGSFGSAGAESFDEQAALIEWAEVSRGRIPLLSMLFAVPNGGHRHKAVAGKLKAEGVKSGVPDLFMPVPRNAYHGLFIEMKHGKNDLTDAQEEWREKLIDLGYRVEVCYSWTEAALSLTSYLGYSAGELG